VGSGSYLGTYCVGRYVLRTLHSTRSLGQIVSVLGWASRPAVSLSSPHVSRLLLPDDASHSARLRRRSRPRGTGNPERCLRATGSRIIHAESSCRVWSDPKRSMTVWALVLTSPGSSPAQHALLIRQSTWARTGRQAHKHRRRDTRQRSGSRSPAQPTAHCPNAWLRDLRDLRDCLTYLPSLNSPAATAASTDEVQTPSLLRLCLAAA